MCVCGVCGVVWVLVPFYLNILMHSSVVFWTEKNLDCTIWSRLFHGSYKLDTLNARIKHWLFG